LVWKPIRKDPSPPSGVGALESQFAESFPHFSGLKSLSRPGVPKKKIPQKMPHLFFALVPSEGRGRENGKEKEGAGFWHGPRRGNPPGKF